MYLRVLTYRSQKGNNKETFCVCVFIHFLARVCWDTLSPPGSVRNIHYALRFFLIKYGGINDMYFFFFCLSLSVRVCINLISYCISVYLIIHRSFKQGKFANILSLSLPPLWYHRDNSLPLSLLSSPYPLTPSPLTFRWHRASSASRGHLWACVIAP